jgi:hypothetical protein
MALAINLLLVLLSTTATLAAFGGETSRKGNESILRRLTPRGYVSLVCLLLTFVVGVLREVRSASSAEEAQRRQQGSDSALAIANESLTDLRRELSRTRDQVARQSEINLVTTLAHDYTAKFVNVSLSFKVHPIFLDGITDPFTFLSRVSRERGFELYTDVTVIHIGGVTGLTGLSILRSDKLEPGPNRHYLTLSGGIVSTITFPSTRVSSHDRHPANLFVDFAVEALSIVISLERKFGSMKDGRAFFKDHVGLDARSCLSHGRGPITCKIKMPVELARDIEEFWQERFCYASVEVTLDDVGGVEVEQKYSLVGFTREENALRINLIQYGEPEVLLGYHNGGGQCFREPPSAHRARMAE